MLAFRTNSWEYVCSRVNQKLYDYPDGSTTKYAYNTTILRKSPYSLRNDWISFVHGEYGKNDTFSSCSPPFFSRDFFLDNLSWSSSDWVFPLMAGYDRNQKNFGSRRADSNGYYGRCHYANDLYTMLNGEFKGSVVAMTYGEVILVGNFQSCDTGWSDSAPVGVLESTKVVYIYNQRYNITFRYGELNKMSVSVKEGDLVEPGTFLGVATKCKMLHLELWKGRGKYEGTPLLYKGVLTVGWWLFDYLGRSSELSTNSRVCQEDPELYAILDRTGSTLLSIGSFVDEVFYQTRMCHESCFTHGFCKANKCVCYSGWFGENCESSEMAGIVILLIVSSSAFVFSLLLVVLFIVVILSFVSISRNKQTTKENIYSLFPFGNKL